MLRLFSEEKRQSGSKSFCHFQRGRLHWTIESTSNPADAGCNSDSREHDDENEAFRSGVARSAGLEPTTQGLEIPCSIQLSYERKSSGFKDGKVNLGSS